MTLPELKETLARAAFGMTRAEAHAAGVCISCKARPILRSIREVQEYDITALCGPCWDRIMQAALEERTP